MEGLDIDGRPGNLLVGGGQAEIAADILEAILLVAQGMKHGLRDLLHQFAQALALRHGQTDGHRIGHQAGNPPQRGIGTRGHRHAHDQIFRPGGPEDIGRQQGDQGLRQAGGAGLGQIVQARRQFGGNIAGGAAQPSGRLAPAAGQGDRFRQIGQVLGPILPVALIARRAAVIRLMLVDFGETAEFAGAGLPVLGQGGIEFRHAPGDQAAAEPIEHDVMAAVHPEIFLRAGLHQGDHPQGIAGEINRAGEFVHHPVEGSLARIGGP